MTTKRQVLTPHTLGQAVELSGGLWRKQILPLRKIQYKGRELNFDKRYLTELANSFKRGAFDQVPAQIADKDNKHNNSPHNFGGELTDVELAADGLYGYFKPSTDGAKILQENPKIGVSARILEGYQRSDGVHFGKALQHVLLTVDPHVSGMKPWEKIQELSADEAPEDTIDLSAETEEETEMPQQRKSSTQTKTVAAGTEEGEVTLSAEEYATFKEMLIERQTALEFAGELEEEDEFDEADVTDEADENAGEPAAVPEAVRLTLDAQSAQILELTNQARTREIDHAVQKLQGEGLAPAIIEAARPLLGLGETTVELSNGDDLDVGTAVTGLLETITELARNGEAFVQYDVELGRTDETDPVAVQREKLLDSWAAAVGE